MTSCARCIELQTAYDDFQQQSKELEEGLESELQAAQKQLEQTKIKLEKVSHTYTYTYSHACMDGRTYGQLLSLLACIE
jgi:hypothetical protein